ncbi:hypothetical protein ATANTOWER_021050 [Ataeniobius toweri]|uniref:Uncharacterized protein n=1 Tax=Ataeniobius toweri TaxID=208326 RepID=A0ABU7BGU0_9TELE|nr:hypothetical protein [Ataeniobius toweri]
MDIVPDVMLPKWCCQALKGEEPFSYNPSNQAVTVQSLSLQASVSMLNFLRGQFDKDGASGYFFFYFSEYGTLWSQSEFARSSFSWDFTGFPCGNISISLYNGGLQSFGNSSMTL